MKYTSLGITRDYPITESIALYFHYESEPYKKYGSWATGHLVEQEPEVVGLTDYDFLVRFEVTGADLLPSISGSYGITTFRGSEIIRLDARR
jgi:hypothetical protein